MKTTEGIRKRKTLIVIHGWGGTFAEAVVRIQGLFDFECRWLRGGFHVHRRTGAVLRSILTDPKPDGHTLAFQKLVVARFLASCGQPASGDPPDPDQWISFPEDHIEREFSRFGIPLLPGPRQRRAVQLREEALSHLKPIMPTIESLGPILTGQRDGTPTEFEAREIIREHARRISADEWLPEMLERIRDMQESGGDLDTVTSAALHGYRLLAGAGEANTVLRYGLDYRYVFLNYHESLKQLATYGPSDVLLADLPVGAFPGFEEDIRYLYEHDVLVKRFEDHHPCTLEQKEALKRLQEQGMIGFLHLSGPTDDDEAGELKCAADLVYENTIAGRPWDREGARGLRHAAHSEDFVTHRCKLGRLLTDLIKGGICKVELTQLMAESIPQNDTYERIRERGWDQLSADWHEFSEDTEGLLKENAYLVNVKRPPGTVAQSAGSSMGSGSDVSAPVSAHDKDIVRILVALAARPKPGKPRITIGKAQDFYSRLVPDADYLFYCYGGSLLVARRLNQADVAFNLGSMMTQIGTEGDGGHGSAAVCRPEANSTYPHRLLGRIASGNFGQFVRYIAFKLGTMGFTVLSTENRSAHTRQSPRGSSRKLILITAAAAAIGILLILTSDRFRPSQILESNRDFFPQIVAEDAVPGQNDEMETGR